MYKWYEDYQTPARTMIKLAIIDDEQDARSVLRALVQSYCPDVQIVGEAHDVPSGVGLIREAGPDIVLLDIQLGGQTGFDLLNKFLNPSFSLIFVTAYDEFAVKAFEYCALDYLLKPIDPDRLILAIGRAEAQVRKERTWGAQVSQFLKTHQTGVFDKIAIPTAEGFVFIKLEDIIYLQSDVNYTNFYMKGDERLIVSKTLKEFEELLPEETFCRTHQSYLLNILYVKKILKEDCGYALLESGEKIPISRRKKEGLMKRLFN